MNQNITKKIKLVMKPSAHAKHIEANSVSFTIEKASHNAKPFSVSYGMSSSGDGNQWSVVGCRLSVIVVSDASFGGDQGHSLGLSGASAAMSRNNCSSFKPAPGFASSTSSTMRRSPSSSWRAAKARSFSASNCFTSCS